jgi:hypothetical protein
MSRGHKFKLSFYAVLGLVLLAAPSPAQITVIESTFADGLEGWTGSPGGAVTHIATGGNPGGFF